MKSILVSLTLLMSASAYADCGYIVDMSKDGHTNSVGMRIKIGTNVEYVAVKEDLMKDIAVAAYVNKQKVCVITTSRGQLGFPKEFTRSGFDSILDSIQPDHAF